MSSLTSLLAMIDRPIEDSRESEGKPVAFSFQDPRSREPLVSAAEAGLVAAPHYTRADRLNWPFLRPLSADSGDVLVRASVAERLTAANVEFATCGVELVLLDGYRSLNDQALLWTFFRDRVRALYPDWSDAEVTKEARRFCWNPSGFNREAPSTWPVHMTGGSIDLTLRSITYKDHLFMGGTFDDPSIISTTRFFERRLVEVGGFERLTSSEQLALLSRRLLVHTLEATGLLNYEEEWWHFDLGTSIWARSLGRKGEIAPAFYPIVEEPPQK